MGISMGFHDAAVTVLDNSDVTFAAHTERYSRKKNDPWLNSDIISEALEHGTPDVIVLHERTWLNRVVISLVESGMAFVSPAPDGGLKTFILSYMASPFEK